MDEHAALVDAILRSPRINNKIVVLCEGDLLPAGDGRPPSPQMYGRLEQLPDSNFYKACIPRDWHNFKLPQFFNCGGRSQVIQTYEDLLAAHNRNSANSYLTPDKLFALVDLDIQPGSLPTTYPWSTTEAVHQTLYKDSAIVSPIDPRHRIWVTALIHKEAFFVLPTTSQQLLSGVPPYLDGVPLDLRVLHNAVASRLTDDADVATHISAVKARLNRYNVGSRLNCAGGKELCDSWNQAVKTATDVQYESLLWALLAVARVKPIWSRVVPEPQNQSTISNETFREQLALRIASSISELSNPTHPLVGFFGWLKAFR